MARRRQRVGMLVAAMVALAIVSGASAQSVPWRESQEPVRETANMTVGDDTIFVELSLTGPQQSLGLGYRNGLAEGSGMLFAFGEASQKTFWMKGMRFCIDIVWIEGGEIVGAAESVCPDPPGTADADRAVFGSGVAVTYVLELPAGWLAEHGYGAGTPIELPAAFG